MDKKVQDTIEEIKTKSIPVFKRYKVKRAGLFGSVVRGEDRTGSDIDFAIQVPRGTGMIKFGRIKLDLEKATGKQVDLVSLPNIRDSFKTEVSRDYVEVYAEKS